MNLNNLMRETDLPLMEILVPVFNEQDIVDIFLKTIVPILDKTNCPYNIVFINDGSQDNTLELIRRAKEKNQNISFISLSRNFGKDAALTAGLDHSVGDIIIPIDVDLQDPPELILTFLDHWRQGYDVVYGIRNDRQTDGFLKRSTASVFYRLFNSMSKIQIPFNTGDYRLMDRKVVEEIKKLRERNRFMKGLMAWPGFRSKGVEFKRPRRVGGTTTWNYWKLFNFALDGLTSFSTAPLRIWTYIGGFLSLVSILYAVYIFFNVLFLGIDVPGYASIMVSVFFIGGIQLVTLGLLGEYLGRIFEEVKNRPLYVVDTVENSREN